MSECISNVQCFFANVSEGGLFASGYLCQLLFCVVGVVFMCQNWE